MQVFIPSIATTETTDHPGALDKNVTMKNDTKECIKRGLALKGVTTVPDATILTITPGSVDDFCFENATTIPRDDCKKGIYEKCLLKPDSFKPGATR